MTALPAEAEKDQGNCLGKVEVKRPSANYKLGLGKMKGFEGYLKFTLPNLLKGMLKFKFEAVSQLHGFPSVGLMPHDVIVQMMQFCIICDYDVMCVMVLSLLPDGYVQLLLSSETLLPQLPSI